MNEWRLLDLTRIDGRPQPGQLTALRLLPENSRSAAYPSARYDIGYFKPDYRTGRKLWWHGARGCEDTVKMKKHYQIWWCEVPAFD